MLRLAGEHGDGLILSNFSFPTALVREGLLEAGMAFDIVDMATPLGPNLDEAIDIICQEIIPELRRRSRSYQEND